MIGSVTDLKHFDADPGSENFNLDPVLPKLELKRIFYSPSN